MSTQNALYRKRNEGVEIIVLDAPGEKVNKLTENMIQEFSDILDQIETDEAVKGVLLISGKQRNFIAGADITMFQERETIEEFTELSRLGQNILNRIEDLKIPVVCAIHGSCMGGGTELALACDYRIVTDDSATKIALPEVQLGLLPGMGGTQRLPALIGLQKALAHMLTGKNMYSYQAKKSGFADEIVHKFILEKAGIEAVKRLSDSDKKDSSKKPFKRTSKRSISEKLLEGSGLGRKVIFDQARKSVEKESKGNYPAPPKIIESVAFGYEHGFEKGLQKESELFGELAITQESRALIQLFFNINRAKNNPLADQVQPVSRVAVIGAGLMGSGIGEVTADNGMDVWLKDQSVEQALIGANRIKEGFGKKVQKRIISTFEKDEKSGRVHPVADYLAFSKIDLVIEAVFEDLELKRKIVKDVEESAGKETIFATNTSSFPISKIAEGARRPENIIGMHYFSPVQKMPLLEIIKTPKTAEWATATAFDVGVKQGKTVIIVNDGPGFYTTRILSPYMNEAVLLLEEGASIEQIDQTIKAFGFPVGPVALLDEVGIDVAAHVANTMRTIFDKRGAKTSAKSAELVENGFKGRKNKKGFYRYEKSSKKKKRVNSEVYQFFGGVKRVKIQESVIRERVLLMMVNEAVYCLQEGVLNSADDGDVGAVLGLGFPPFLGGPFRYIDREGAAGIVEKLEAYRKTEGERFKPAEMLVEYAEQGRKFYEEA